MKNVFLGAVFALVVAISGCATQGVDPQNAGQTVYLAIAKYQATLRYANEYQSLPDCGPGGIPVATCSTAEVRAKVQAAKEAGWTALQGAEAAVRDPGFDQSREAQILAIAQAGMSTLQAIIAQLQAAGYNFK